MGSNILSWIIFTPLIGALLVALLPRSQKPSIKAAAFLISLITFSLTVVLCLGFDSSLTGFQFQERYAWLPDFGVFYHVGVDGISLWLVMLTALVSMLAIGFSFTVQDRIKEFMIFTLLLETAILGVFCALDLILFYVFFELTLVPMYLMIVIWGGEKRAGAAIKFFLYTFLGSIFMLVSMIWLFFIQLRATNVASFNLIDMQNFVAQGGVPIQVQSWLFLAFALAFAIKLPLVPFHTWMPDAQGEAPIAANVIFLKIGAYAFLRFAIPLFPDAAQREISVLMPLAVAGIVYAAIVAAVQTDMKRLVLYASISHAGFAMLGLFALNEIGLTGSVFQQINHGVSTAALFLLLGMLYNRRKSFQIGDYGGLKKQMPIFSALFLIVMLSAIGLPGTNGFIGEFLCLLGAYQTNSAGLFGTNVWYTVIGATGMILAAVYMLWMFQRVFYGPVPEENRNLKDLRPWEVALVLPLIILIFWIGLRPVTFTEKMATSIASGLGIQNSELGKREARNREDGAHEVEGSQLFEPSEHSTFPNPIQVQSTSR